MRLTKYIANSTINRAFVMYHSFEKHLYQS